MERSIQELENLEKRKFNDHSAKIVELNFRNDFNEKTRALETEKRKLVSHYEKVIDELKFEKKVEHDTKKSNFEKAHLDAVSALQTEISKFSKDMISFDSLKLSLERYTEELKMIQADLKDREDRVLKLNNEITEKTLANDALKGAI